jgi:hypothetical protein
MEDFDGDHDRDLFLANRGGRPDALCLNDGYGIFADVTSDNMPSEYKDARGAVAGDVDGDDDLDLIVANRAKPDALYLNDGSGVFSDKSSTQMPGITAFSSAVAIGNVDDDDDLDIVFADSKGQTRLYLNDKFGVFSDVTSSQMPIDSDESHAVALVDVDDDKDLDLVIGNSEWPGGTGKQNRLYLNDGFGFFSDVTGTQMPSVLADTMGVGVGDVDGDGDPDLVFANVTQGRLYLNDSYGFFSAADISRIPPATGHNVVLGDIDEDGDLDLVFGGNTVSLMLNDGTGTFSDVSGPYLGEGLRGHASLGDVDFDGDLDLLLGVDGQNRIHFNLLRQLDAPYLMASGKPYVIDIYARGGPPRPADLAIPMISLGTAQIPVPPYGVLGLDPASAVILPAVAVPQPEGLLSMRTNIPSVPALVGVTFYFQVWLWQGSFGMPLTNVMGEVYVH